ncbi:hypothetical protein RRG08_056567 [Elysia crispata]|uniref:Uncharacterized protein n=1 Tax=Elysia crispata TaxID=231223 RepID=A0AAE1AMY3_9GAST|nr:hypothetical protein RRG08_056567 [Elysia crispata]
MAVTSVERGRALTTSGTPERRHEVLVVLLQVIGASLCLDCCRFQETWGLQMLHVVFPVIERGKVTLVPP